MRYIEYLLILLVIIIAAAGATNGYLYWKKVADYDNLLTVAVRFQSACLASGPNCINHFEGKPAELQTKK